MDIFVDEYSGLTILAALILVLALAILSRRARWQEYAIVGAISLALIVGWWNIRPTQTPLMDDAKTVQAMIGEGKPVLLEFQSPY